MRRGMVMLLNVKSEIPKSFYIFVDSHNPLTVQTLRSTRAFSSSAYTKCYYDESFLEKYLKGGVKYLPYKKSNQDLDIFSPYYVSVVNYFDVEYDAECFRQKYYPMYPSRLSAVYAFGDYETCVKVSKIYQWDLKTVRKFKLVNNKLTRVIKVNMEIVSIARDIYKNHMFSKESKELLWENYWRGSSYIPTESYYENYPPSNLKVDEVFEYLIEGSLVLEE